MMQSIIELSIPHHLSGSLARDNKKIYSQSGILFREKQWHPWRPRTSYQGKYSPGSPSDMINTHSTCWKLMEYSKHTKCMLKKYMEHDKYFWLICMLYMVLLWSHLNLNNHDSLKRKIWHVINTHNLQRKSMIHDECMPYENHM